MAGVGIVMITNGIETHPSYIPILFWLTRSSSSSYSRAGTGIVPSTPRVYRWSAIRDYGYSLKPSYEIETDRRSYFWIRCKVAMSMCYKAKMPRDY